MKYNRNCPKCNGNIEYKCKDSFRNANKKNSKCRKCATIKTEEHKRKIGKSNKGKRKDKTHVEIFGKDKADEIRRKRSVKMTGRKRSSFSEEWRNNISISHKNSEKFQSVMKSDEYREKRRKIAVENQTNVSYDEWLLNLDVKDKYYHKVMRYTNKQQIHLLENYELRGNSKNDGYHLDHKISISYGFHNNIPPEEIGDISNLRFIHWKENIRKGSDCE